MKQQWAAAELLDHWKLTDTEKGLVNQYHTGSNRVACALLMKYFQREGRFPRRKQDIPRVIVEYIADQLYLTPAAFGSYKWERGTIDRHRSRIRRFLSVRTGTTADANSVLTWLKTHTRYLEEHNLDRLKETVYERYKELKIEPPQPKRIERMVHSAVRSADEGLYSKIEAQLTPEIREKLDALLNEHTQIPAAPAFSDLKNEAGGPTLENVLSETAKLERIRAIALPGNLFAEVSHKRLLWCKQRIAVEDLSEIRRHPPQVRYSLLAAFCTVRATEITDTLVELLIAVIHKMGSRAKRIVDREVVRDIKRVQGKNRLLYQVASASLDQPGGTVKEVIYPIAPEQGVVTTLLSPVIATSLATGAATFHKAQTATFDTGRPRPVAVNTPARALANLWLFIGERLDSNWARGPETRGRARGICFRRKRQRIFLRSPSRRGEPAR